MTNLNKVCETCMISHPIAFFPLRENGKTRAHCHPCFREYTNKRRRKKIEAKDITELPVAITLVAGGQENWVDVVAQVMMDEKFLSLPGTDSEFIDLKALLKTKDHIANLLEEERAHEKNSYLSPRFDRRTSQGRRGLDQEPNRVDEKVHPRGESQA